MSSKSSRSSGAADGGKTPKTPKTPKVGNVIKKKKRARHESYGIYTHKVLQEVHEGMRIKRKTTHMIDSLLEHILDKYVNEAYALTIATSPKKKGIKTRTFQLATRQVLTGEIAKHAHSEGMKAVTKFAALNA
jgi:histone H2B